MSMIWTRTKVAFIYTFLSSLSSTSPIVEQGFQSIHHLQMTSSEGFQQYFSIISNFFCCGFYMKKNVAFTLISFAILNEMIVYQFVCHLSYRQRYTYRVLQTIQMKLILLCVWAEPAHCWYIQPRNREKSLWLI